MTEGIPKLQELLKKKDEEISKLQNEINAIEKENSSHREGCRQP